MNSQVILEIVGLNLKVAGVHERLHLPHTELEINCKCHLHRCIHVFE
ncbi:hypothetical protein HanHA89_Chr15g0626091 [Helianthus annuus]|nr:hypothetical protein HanHA89_Chr15g0626091 [Helianthus annuus]